jgi:predicted RNA methylase
VRNVARIKVGYYPLPPAETARLRSLLRFAPGSSALDPCAGTGAALHELTAGGGCEKHAVELDAERAAVAAASGIATVHGNLFDTVGRVESFSSFTSIRPMIPRSASWATCAWSTCSWNTLSDGSWSAVCC